jgi:hypothetical protein
MVAAKGRQCEIETKATPIRQAADLVGADADSDRALAY